MGELETILKFLMNTTFLVNFGPFLFPHAFQLRAWIAKIDPTVESPHILAGFQGGGDEIHRSHLDSSLPIWRKRSLSWMFDPGVSPGR